MKHRNSAADAKKARRKGRRHPLALAGLLASGLVITGTAYAAATAAPAASAEVNLGSAQTIEEGKALFDSNCATCHGMNAVGTENGPSLVGVGAAAVDFQVGTGRMPMQMNGPQAMRKPPQFTQTQIDELAAYVASLAPGPGIPDAKYLDAKGDVARGAELFRINCAMCHNVAGAGGALTEGKFAPKLTGVEAKHIYEAMETGPQNMPAFSDTNLSPEDKRDIISALKFQEESTSVGGFELGSLGPVAEGLFIWIFGIGAIVSFAVWLTARSN